MRIALTVLAVFVLLAMPSARAESDTAETIGLLVPIDTPTGELQTRSSSDSRVGWKRIVVPVDGSADQTRAAWERELGTAVLVEREYPLLGGENEPDFVRQWGLENTGQEGGAPGADIDIRRAWSVATGHGVVVAVIDSGVNASHPDLVDQVIPGRDFVDNDNDPSPVGDNPNEAHGTFIAGIIAAKVNGEGMAGVAPDARVLNVRACSEGTCLTLDAVNGIYYAVDQGADVINLSFGGPFHKDSPDHHPLASAIDYARAKGVLVVTAAGNESPESIGDDYIIVPAELPHANNMAVAASDRSDSIAGGYYGPNIDIAAPGMDVWSSTISGYAFGDGTSFAAPQVAGVAALVKSTDLSMGYQELAARIMAWVDRPAGIAGRVESGRVSAGNVLHNRFVDTLNHTFESAARWAADDGVTKGCNPPENTLFCPDESVTRGQMAAFLTRHLGLPAATRDHFEDDDGSTFEKDINRLAEAGITKGCNPPANDRFCGDQPVNREQMAALLVRALNLTEDNHSGFGDVSDANIFVRDIERLATAGITRGCNPPNNTSYCPKDEVTRGQMAAFLFRSEN